MSNSTHKYALWSVIKQKTINIFKMKKIKYFKYLYCTIKYKVYLPTRKKIREKHLSNWKDNEKKKLNYLVTSRSIEKTLLFLTITFCY